jgi:hypothetical protein
MATETFTPRLICMEDLLVSQLYAYESSPQTVLGAGTVSLTPIPLTLITQLVVAASDTAAAGLGVAVGDVYVQGPNVQTPTYKLHTRMS